MKTTARRWEMGATLARWQADEGGGGGEETVLPRRICHVFKVMCSIGCFSAILRSAIHSIARCIFPPTMPSYSYTITSYLYINQFVTPCGRYKYHPIHSHLPSRIQLLETPTLGYITFLLLFGVAETLSESICRETP